MSASTSQAKFLGVGRQLSEVMPTTNSQKTLEPLVVNEQDATETLHGGSIVRDEEEKMLTSISVSIPGVRSTQATAQKQINEEAYGQAIQRNVGVFRQKSILQSRSASLSPHSSQARSIRSTVQCSTLNKPSLNSTIAYNTRPKNTISCAAP